MLEIDYILLENCNSRKKISQALKKCTCEATKKMLELKAKYIGINEFFPTPKSVVEQIFNHFPLPYSSMDNFVDYKILEPSAGTGDFMDHLLSFYIHWRKDMFECCEINPDFREMLELKGYKIITDDFVKLKNSEYDAVIMNPPFEYCKKHLIKAISLLKHEGMLVCIAPSMFKVKEQQLLEDFELDVLPITDGAFKGSCTGVATDVIIGTLNSESINKAKNYINTVLKGESNV